MTTKRVRLIDDIDFAEIRKQPHSTWLTYSNWLFNIYGDLTDNNDNEIANEMLRELYCNERARDVDESFIMSMVAGLCGQLFCNPETVTSDFIEMIRDPLVDTRTPVLIIGDVGVGKTTYLHHFFEVDIKETEISNFVDTVIIDCRDIGDYESNEGKKVSLEKINNFIDKEIELSLKAKYQEFDNPTYEVSKKIFNEELKPQNFIFDKLRKLGKSDLAELKILEVLESCINDKHMYNIGRLRFIRRKYNRKIYIVLDNVDHLGINLQSAIFKLSKSLMKDYQCPFILACRYYTLQLAYKHMELSAFEPRFIHLTSPLVECVINKRKDFMLRKIERGNLKSVLGSDAIIIEDVLGERNLSIEEINNITSDILDSFLTEQILYILKKLSNTDVRTLLKLVKSALSSGYIYPDNRRAKYKVVQPYDLITALMLGNNVYYNPNSSIILNLFDNENKNYEGNNLIRIRLLQTVDSFGNNPSTKDVVEFMDSIGYDRKETNELIYKLLLADLIESPYEESIKIPPYNELRDQCPVEFLRITPCGKYYIDELILKIRYSEEVQHATYMPKKFYDNITSLKKHDSLARYQGKRDILASLKSVEEFRRFIKEEEETEIKRVKNKDNYNKLGEPLYSQLEKAHNIEKVAIESQIYSFGR